MKTKEFMEKVGNSQYNARVCIDGNFPKVLSIFSNNKIVGKCTLVNERVEIEHDCPKEIALWLVEYAKTPLEEREEEKKYRLVTPFVKKDINYLAFDLDKKTYFISEYIQTQFNYKKTFTQKEIDAMPFDTNFFIKEEV